MRWKLEGSGRDWSGVEWGRVGRVECHEAGASGQPAMGSSGYRRSVGPCTMHEYTLYGGEEAPAVFLSVQTSDV